MKALAGALLAVCLVSAPARATETPVSLYLAGHFAQAEAAGVAQNDAGGFALAARAVLAEDMMRDEPCLACLKHAEDLSRRAIAADPAQPEAHIYLAAAMGYEARIIGDLAAQSRGYAGKAKKQLDAALASDPNDPWALAALGSWHIEIVRSAGPALARWLFGAKFATGQDCYEKAFALAPANLVLHYQHALVIAEYDLPAYRQDIENELTGVIAGNAGSAYEAFVRGRAQQLLDALRGGDLVEVRRLVRHDQGYPDSA
jgi:tetratricopeptide (TPR) repeat protein